MKLTKRLMENCISVIAIGVIMSVATITAFSFEPEVSESKTTEEIVTTEETILITQESEKQPNEEISDDNEIVYETDFVQMNTPTADWEVVEMCMTDESIISSEGEELIIVEQENEEETTYIKGVVLEEAKIEVADPEPIPDYSVIPLDRECIESLIESSDESGIDICVALALMESESGFQTDAVSSVGCYGLMQLHPLYYPTNLTPAENIKYGVETLGKNYMEYNDMRIALDVYGNGHVTYNFAYPDDVLSRAEEWRETLTEANIL